MIISTRKCDGCGEKIDPVDLGTLSNITDECVKQVSQAGAMFLSVYVKAMGWVEGSDGQDSVELGLRATFEICTKCAETCTIASFKLQKPAR